MVDNLASYGSENTICDVTRFSDPKHFFHVAKRIADENENHLYTNDIHHTANELAHY